MVIWVNDSLKNLLVIAHNVRDEANFGLTVKQVFLIMFVLKKI